VPGNIFTEFQVYVALQFRVNKRHRRNRRTDARTGYNAWRDPL